MDFYVQRRSKELEKKTKEARNVIRKLSIKLWWFSEQGDFIMCRQLDRHEMIKLIVLNLLLPNRWNFTPILDQVGKIVYGTIDSMIFVRSANG